MKKTLILFLAGLLAVTARASLVSFAFTNAGTGMLDTNDFKLVPLRQDYQNADGSWTTAGLTIRVHNPTGLATNYLVQFS